ncbi:MAG: hypothetical protein AMJ84_00050 [Acidithiobacillales bacterium SM23_46]|nr:MAG: hypothetical protein AMJ84_00050 [Acidithiobacillales bacterium SM23_46]KPL28990.1 MAG: hypothetical protein AMJ72_00065 [Acidithiobacillales bacterium SM1_46]
MTISKTLTEPREGEARQVWAQREYVEALAQGLGFAAHGDRWLYYDREARRGTILYPFSNGEGCQRIEAPISNGLDWIEQLARY